MDTTTNKILLIWALFLCTLTAVFAQPTRYYFDHLSTNEGLSQNDVNCILQDRTGFMWFGTNDGLNLYNGYEFRVFKPNEEDSTAIITNIIQTLEEDAAGRIWIGTPGEGLSCYLPRYDRFVNLKNWKREEALFPSDFVLSLFVDSKKRLWVGSSKGLRVFQISDAYEISKNSLSDLSSQILSAEIQSSRAYQIIEDEHQNIWISANSGLFKLEPKTEEARTYQASRLIDGNIKGLVRGKGLDLIAGSGEGLYQLSSKEGNTYEVLKLDEEPHDNLLYTAGAIWTSSQKGLTKFVYEAGSNKLLKEHRYTSDLRDFHSLSKSVLHSIYADRNGIIWIGSNGGGINKFEPRQKIF
ncbi:MAG: two-component regulator propeller domain-containing protein, partial [Bacteroidota bacterium]